MPIPTVATSSVFAKANAVVKLEVLPVPNVTADFHINHNTEVLLGQIRDIWESYGPVIMSGFVATFATGQWTVTQGRVLVDGYDISFNTDFVFSPLAADQEVVVRVTESRHTFESDPSFIGFIPPGFADQKAGSNQYRYTVTRLVKAVADATPAPVAPQSKITDYRIMRIASNGTSVLERRTVLTAPVRDVVQKLVEDVQSLILTGGAIPATEVVNGLVKLNAPPYSPLTPEVAATTNAAGGYKVIGGGLTRKGSLAGSGTLGIGTNPEDQVIVHGHTATVKQSFLAASAALGEAHRFQNHTSQVVSPHTMIASFVQNTGAVLAILQAFMSDGSLRLVHRLGPPEDPIDGQIYIYCEDNNVASPNQQIFLKIMAPGLKPQTIWASELY